MKYFGDPKFRKSDEEQVETPIGVPCLYCEDPIQAGDTGTIGNTINDKGDWTKEPIHYECGIRMGVGSVGHQKGLCSCFGGTEEDPERMTKHEAAIAAARYFHLHS